MGQVNQFEEQYAKVHGSNKREKSEENVSVKSINSPRHPCHKGSCRRGRKEGSHLRDSRAGEEKDASFRGPGRELI